MLTGGPSLGAGSGASVGVVEPFKKEHAEQEFLLPSHPRNYCSNSLPGLSLLIFQPFVHKLVLGKKSTR